MNDLQSALDNPLWKSHKIGDIYEMDGNTGWKIAYYPLFGTYEGENKQWVEFNEPRALVEKPAIFEGVQGTDFREVPLRYLKRV